MKSSRVIIMVVVGLVVVGGAIAALGMKRSERLEELSKQASTEARYRKCDAYFKGSEADRKYVDEIFQYANERARDHLNGLFSPPPAPERYYATLYQMMVTQAKEAGKGDIAKSLHTWMLGQGYMDIKL